MGQRGTVEGAVQSVIFQNEENGYTVLTLIVDGQEEPGTVVGCIPCAAGELGRTWLRRLQQSAWAICRILLARRLMWTAASI